MVLTARIERWSKLDLDKVTEMISRKIVSGRHQMLVQVYLKCGAQIPLHTHASEQIVYVLQGKLQCLVGDRFLTVREGEVIYIPSGVSHQIEAIEDTFQLAVFSPIREEWLS